MRISINGAETEVSVFQGATLKEVLDGIFKDHPGSYARRIWLERKEVSTEDQDTLMTSVAGIELLEIELASLHDVFANNVKNAKEYLEKLIPGFKKAADLFRMENEQEANKYYVQILDGVDWFSQVVMTIIESCGDNNEEQGLGKRQKKLTELISQMLEANQNQDWVLMADLLEYEMIPFYEEWGETLSRIEGSSNDMFCSD